jgi:hypothetical protein
MRSPPHCEIILTGTFTDVGVAVAPSVPSTLGAGEAGATYVVEFAARHREGRPTRACPGGGGPGRPLRPPRMPAPPRPISPAPASPSTRD